MDHLYAIDLAKAKTAGEILRDMRGVVGRAKKTVDGECRLAGVALGRRGERLFFRFRLKKE